MHYGNSPTLPYKRNLGIAKVERKLADVFNTQTQFRLWVQQCFQHLVAAIRERWFDLAVGVILAIELRLDHLSNVFAVERHSEIDLK